MTAPDRLTEAERGALRLGALPVDRRRRHIEAAVESILAARTASLTAERDTALAAVAGIEEVARRVLHRHQMAGYVHTSGAHYCLAVGCTWESQDPNDFRAHQAERIASELRGEG